MGGSLCGFLRLQRLLSTLSNKKRRGVTAPEIYLNVLSTKGVPESLFNNLDVGQ